MRKEQAGLQARSSQDLEHQSYAIARDVYRTIHASSLDKFTYSWVDSLWNNLTLIVYELEHLPESSLVLLMEVIEGLREARNELRLARFLFDVEEIDPVYRLIMRNRAVLRAEHNLARVITVWTQRA